MLKKSRAVYWIVTILFAFLVCVIWFCYEKPFGNGTGIKERGEVLKPDIITYAQGKDTTFAYKTLIKVFEKENPDIKVNFEELPSSTDDQHNILATKFSAEDRSYDLVATDLVWTAEFAESGWLQALDKYFSKKELEKYFEWRVRSASYNGHIYGIPRMSDIGLLYYRKDILSRAPQSWEELIDMCKKYTGKGGTKYGIVFEGNEYEGLICNAVEFIFSNGGNIMNNGRVTINTPQAVGGLKYMRKLIEDGYTPPEVTTYQEDDAALSFQQGKVLFMRNWPYAWFQVNTYDNSVVKGKVGIARIPRGRDGKKGVSCLGGWNIGMNKNSLHKGAAIRFLKFITGMQGEKIAAIKTGMLPTMKALYRDKDILHSRPYMDDFSDILQTAVLRPVSKVYPALSDQLQSNFHRALTGEITAEQAVKNIEKNLAYYK